MSGQIFDTLIVGQGLAGSALAWHLLGAGERVCVIDDGYRSSSSMVAAGLINPLAGMRFNCRPGVPDWLRAAERWYTELGTRFGQQFLHALPMLRLLRSPRQRRFYDRRANAPDGRALVGPAFGSDNCPEAVAASHGGFVQRHTGYVDLPLLLTTLGGWLHDRGALRRATADPSAITIDATGVRVDGVAGRRLVFCDGARLRDNPWFDWLPLAAVKGEIVNLRHPVWQPRHIINGAHWLVPMHNGELRFGATHDHSRLDGAPTAAGRSALLAGYRAMRPGDTAATLVGHRAGVRPGTADHNPFIGRHPRLPALWVCNGFGARGALSIPWYTARLGEHLCHGAPLPPEADIRRL